MNDSEIAAALATLTEQIRGDRAESQAFRGTLAETIARIERQTEKTNGRVTRLELWRMFLLGGFAALAAPWAIKAAQFFHAP